MADSEQKSLRRRPAKADKQSEGGADAALLPPPPRADNAARPPRRSHRNKNRGEPKDKKSSDDDDADVADPLPEDYSDDDDNDHDRDGEEDDDDEAFDESAFAAMMGLMKNNAQTRDPEAFAPQPSAKERKALRRGLAKEWAEDLPLRIRQFVRHNTDDITTRIYREMIIRFPMLGCSEEEVLSLVQPFGQVQYISPVNSGPTQVKSPLGAADEEITEAAAFCMDSSYAHLVRFDEGIDAIQAFFALNGAIVDPQQYNNAIEQVLVSMAASSDAAAKALRENPLPENMFASADGGKTNPNALIFVTCDFFRAAFTAAAAPPLKLLSSSSSGEAAAATATTCSGGLLLPARASLVSGRRPPPGKRVGTSNCQTAGGDSPANPSHAIARELADRAAEMARFHPLVCSYAASGENSGSPSRGVSWQRFCVAANMVAFLFPAPSAGSIIDALASRQRLSRRAIESQLFNVNGDNTGTEISADWYPGAVTIAHEGLKNNDFDVERLLRKCDKATSALEVATGQAAKAPLRARLAKEISRTFAVLPTWVLALLLVLTSVCISALWFIAVKMSA